MTRSLPFIALLALPAAGCSVRSSSAQERAADADPIVRVTTAPVTTRSVPRTLTLTGTLTANRESGVAADVMGKVSAVYVERGSRVRAGAPLVRLDRRQAALMEQEARSQAAAAQTQATLAQGECTRAQKLFDEGAINQAEYDRAKAQCQAASAQAAAAAARRELAGKNVGDLVVKAPFGGMVADRFVNEGEYVRPDSRVAAVVQLDPLRLELSVPESALASFGVGAEVKFHVAAWPSDSFTGKVRFAGATVRRATRDLLVEAVVPNKDERLRPGMFAVAEVTLGEESLAAVPRDALRTDDRGGTDRVFVVTGGHAEERLVRAGRADGDQILIASGLRAGERVVRRPSPALHDGQRVQ
jgi:membrane fusion protein (multidrug efflux system)